MPPLFLCSVVTSSLPSLIKTSIPPLRTKYPVLLIAKKFTDEACLLSNNIFSKRSAFYWCMILSLSLVKQLCIFFCKFQISNGVVMSIIIGWVLPKSRPEILIGSSINSDINSISSPVLAFLHFGLHDLFLSLAPSDSQKQ